MVEQILRYALTNWHTAFVLTLLIEVPIFVLLSRGEVKMGRAALAGALGSVISHPLLWFAWKLLFTNHLYYLLSGEVLVAILESVTFFLLARPVGWWRAVSASCVANGLSYGTGIVLWWAIN